MIVGFVIGVVVGMTVIVAVLRFRLPEIDDDVVVEIKSAPPGALSRFLLGGGAPWRR